MFYDKSYVLSDYLNYDDLNELVDKEKELINEVAYQEVGDTENVLANGKEYETGSDYYLEGNTIQNGSPTPTSPIEVETITGRQEISVVGKNLLPINIESGSTKNGLTITKNEDGSYTLNGTSTANTTWNLYTGENITIPVGTYTGSIVGRTNIIDGYIRLNNGAYQTIFNNTSDTNTFTINEPFTFNRFYIYISNNKTFNNQIIKLQLEKGTTASEYEEYRGQSYEINLGKNLMSLRDNTNTANGLTGTISGNTITINGTNTKTDANWILVGTGVNLGNSIFPNFEAGETYTLSVNENMKAYVQINYYRGATTTQASLVYLNLETSNNKTFTVPSDFGGVAQFFVGIIRTASDINTTINIQLEKGSIASSFSPYKTPIELCKIGDYKDKIFKSKGKQLFNKDNINLIDSYYVDGTGKIVFGTNNKFNWVKLEPNKTYTLSQPIKSNVTVRPALFNTTPIANATGTVLGTFTGTTPIIQTFTTTDTYIYIGWVYCNTAQLSGHTQQEMLDCIMINEGSIALQYEPYGTNGKWLLHKEIGKIVLDGSETNWKRNANGRFYREFSDIMPYTDNSRHIDRVLSDHFKPDTNYANQMIGIMYQHQVSCYFFMLDTTLTTVDAFKTWLVSNNVEVYYVLATPTTTEITDTELISELEEISSKIKYWNYEQILPIENYDLDLPTYELNDFVYLEDINKIEKNIMQLSYDFYQPPGYIKNKIWRTAEDLDVYKSFSYEDINRMITDMNILYEHRLDTPTIYNLYTNENWDGETTLEWE